MNIKAAFSLIPLLFVFGCVSTSYNNLQEQNSRDILFREQALNELEKYKISWDIGIKGFYLGKELTATSIKEIRIEEISGCLINQFVDELFGNIAVSTDSNGIIVKIVAIKQFDSWLEATKFYDSLRETITDKYSISPSRAQEMRKFDFIEILGTNDEEHWIQSYITSLSLKPTWEPVHSYKHYMIIHPYLYKLTLGAIETKNRFYVCLDYISTQYKNMLEAVKRKTKVKMDSALD